MRPRGRSPSAVTVVATLVILLALAGTAAPTAAIAIAASAQPAAGQDVSFTIEETLTLPTTHSVVLTLVPFDDAELYVAYGATDGRWTTDTPTLSVDAGFPAEFLITGLKPGHEYAYRVFVRPGGSAVEYVGRQTERFRTLRRAGEPVTFAYTADAHLYDLWAKATFGGSVGGYDHVRKSFENLAADDSLDFFVLAGDHASTHCHNCPGGMLEGVNYHQDYALVPEQGLLRYQKLLAPEHVGQVARRTPFFWVLGNHEGETAVTMNGCGHNELNAMVSRDARRTYLPDPYPFFGGNDRGTYYSFASGDARVVVLDVMGYSNALPVNANGWSLGTEQLAWLDKVLATSDEKWTFVIAEHLVGGATVGLVQCYHYGRGGIRSTVANKLKETFLGEQALVQEIVARHVTPGGASFFMTGHDHVAMLPLEKPDLQGVGTGVYYVKAGSIGAAPGWWKNDAKFQKQMDWDFDGEADYFAEETGTDRRGYWRITVDGEERVVFDYVITSLWPNPVNASVLLSRTIEAE